jgi:acyl-CoA synthetase (AMP-forming)/AMP-acid ligase II
MLSFKPRAADGVDPLDAMRAFSDNVKMCAVGVSLGEVDTLVYPMPKRGGIFRISVGIESAQDIIAFCRRHLAHFKCPRTVVFTTLPKTSTGKIQKFVLREEARRL